MKPTVALTAGGTGGHLFPALSLADELEKNGYQPLLITSPKDVKKKWIQDTPYEHIVLPAVPPRQWKTFPFQFHQAFRKACTLLLQKKPLALFSFGSYVSLAPSFAALWQGIPLVCFEQNAVPGRVNRLLNPLAHTMVLQWMESAKYFFYPFNLQFWGSPVRPLIRESKEKALHQLGLHPDKMTILVMGGSQGARVLNNKVIEALPYLESLKDKIQWIHLTGLEDEERIRKEYQKSGFTYFVEGFSEKMGLLYSAADVLFARSGGSTIWEASRFSLPMILVPYPYAASNHQMANAKAAEERGAALVLEQKNLTPQRIQEFTQLLLHPGRRKKMGQASWQMANPDKIPEVFRILEEFQEKRIMRRKTYAA